MKLKKLSLQKDTLLPLGDSEAMNIAGGRPISGAIPFAGARNNVCVPNTSDPCVTEGCPTATCATNCNQATCATCATNCGTCATCGCPVTHLSDCRCTGTSAALRASCLC